MTINELQKKEVKDLIRNGNKKEAVWYLTNQFNLSQRDSHKLVKAIEREIEKQPEQKPGCFGKVGGGIFSVLGFIILVSAANTFLDKYNFVESAGLVKGKVINYPSQPLFEYEYEGVLYNYQSTTSTEPPAYSLGEEVDIYVNPENPKSVLINTFTERWFLVMLLGLFGIVFTTIGVLVLYHSR